MTLILILLLVAAMVLLSLEVVPVDLVALGMLVVLLLTGILKPAEALAGFGNEAVVVIGGLFVLTAGLRITGTVDLVARWMQGWAGGRPQGAQAALLLITVVVSGVLANTTCTALFLPVALVLAEQAGTSPSRLLMPLAFASILGGSLTAIGTSTNLVVSGLLPQYDQPPLALFEMLPVALPIAGVGLLYLLVLRHRLPARTSAVLEQRYALGEFLTEVVVDADSSLVGKTIAQADFGRQWDLNLLALRRDQALLPPEPGERLAAGDMLVVAGPVKTLAQLSLSRGLRVHHSLATSDAALHPQPLHLVEVLVMPRSDFVLRTLKEIRFRQRYGANVIAVNRHAGLEATRLGHIRLRAGDTLLVQASLATIDELAEEPGLVVLRDRTARPQQRRFAAIAAGIFAAVLGLAATQLLPLAGAVLLGCLALVATRCLTAQEAYAAIEWRLLMLIAGMMAFGAAMEKTGTAALIASQVVGWTADLGPRGLLAGFYVLTLLLTQPMSNQAAALVVLPVAMEAALSAGLNPRAMAVTIAMAASCSFLTPFEPSCMLIYGPGGYRFGDFPRFGLGLTLIALIFTLLLVPVVWP